MAKYHLIMEFKTGDVIPAIREIENEVNKTMQSFGFGEKMFFQSELPCIEMETERPLTQEEEQGFVNVANQRLTETNSPFRCVRIERRALEEILRIG